MNKSPSFQFFTKEWLSSQKILFMTPEQEGAYIRLLAYQWEDPDCTLPDDDEKLAILSRLGKGWLSNGHSVVMRKCFPPCVEMLGKLRNNRLYREKLRQEEWRKKSSVGGVAGSKSRWEKKKRKRKGGQEMVNTVVKDYSQPNDDIAVCSLQSAVCSKQQPPLPPQGGGLAFVLAKEYVSTGKGPTRPAESVERWFQSGIDKGIPAEEIQKIIYDPDLLRGAQAWEIVKHLEKTVATKSVKPEIFRAKDDDEKNKKEVEEKKESLVPDDKRIQKELHDALIKTKIKPKVKPDDVEHKTTQS